MKKRIPLRDWCVLVANGLDHCDMVLYGFLAPLMAPAFFPKESPVCQLILMYGIFAASSLTRPLGGIFFGWLAHQRQPIVALRLSLMGVGASTFLIGCLPPCAIMGVMAPLLLTLLRACQSICSAGESAVARFYVQEGREGVAAKKSSYYFQLSSMLGIVLGSFISAKASTTPPICGLDAWRWCFLSGGCIALFAFLPRMGTNVQKGAYKFAPRHILKIAAMKNLFSDLAFWTTTLLYGLSYASYAIPFILMNSLLPLISPITFTFMLESSSWLLVIDTLLIFILGPLSIHIKTNFLIKFSALSLTITLPFLFYWLPDAQMIYVTSVRLVIVTLGVALSVQLPYYVNKLFPSEKKYLIGSVADALGSSLLGRTFPAVGLMIWQATGSCLMVALYGAAIGLVTFGFLCFLTTQATVAHHNNEKSQ